MKKYILSFFFLISCNSFYAQNYIDSFIGSEGVFNKLKPKTIKPNNVLSFDLRVTILSTAIKGSKKQSEIIMYLNTMDGYVAIDRSLNSSKMISENNTDLDLIVETLTKQSFKYSNSSGIKKVEKLESNLINTYNNLPFKKSNPAIAKSKKYLKNTISAAPYFIETSGLQKKYTRYCYGTENSLEGNLKSYLGSFGVGFYNVSDKTILCVATEHPFMNIEITKIEKVKVVFDGSKFKL